MADFDWKSIVRTLAPAAATAFGTPVMGAAVTMLSNAIFGVPDKGADEVVNAISSGQLSGDQIAAIRKADNDFKVAMGAQGIDLAKIEADTTQAYLKDTQDARARQIATKDTMPQQIFYLLLAVYVVEMALFYFGKMPSDEFVRALMTRAFGTIEIGLTGAIGFFIGTSKSSKDNGESIRRIAEMPVLTPVAAPVPAAPQVVVSPSDSTTINTSK